MRELTAVLYLNEPLESPPPPVVTCRAERGARLAAAGSLLIYVGTDAGDTTGVTASSVVEIAPVGGRLVLFDSRTILHEVTPHTNPHADRIALTLWIGGPHNLTTLLQWIGRLAVSCRPAWASGR